MWKFLTIFRFTQSNLWQLSTFLRCLSNREQIFVGDNIINVRNCRQYWLLCPHLRTTHVEHIDAKHDRDTLPRHVELAHVARDDRDKEVRIQGRLPGQVAKGSWTSQRFCEGMPAYVSNEIHISTAMRNGSLVLSRPRLAGEITPSPLFAKDK